MMMIIPFTSMNILSNNVVYSQEYDGYNSYNKYPTKDNKYECQKGPFEGFFVGSVEFCKFKFDDRKDNRTGIKGQQELQGIQGPQDHKTYQVPMEPTVLIAPMKSMEPMELMAPKLTHVLHVYLML